MKTVSHIIIAILLSVPMFGQNIIDKYYGDFAAREDIKSVYVAGKLFNYASYIETDDEDIKEFKDFLSSITSFNLISVPKLDDPKKEYQWGKKRIAKNFEELLTVREENTNFSFYIDEEDGIIYELVGIGTAEGDFIVGSLTGEIKLDKVAEMISKIDGDQEGTELLQRFSGSGIADVNVYPNPVGKGAIINIEVPENLIGAQANLLSVDGAVVSSQKIRSQTETMSTNEISPGQYFVNIESDGVSIKRKVIVLR